jgi:hypothetical protein
VTVRVIATLAGAVVGVRELEVCATGAVREVA